MVVEDTPDLREFLVKNFEDTYGVLSAKNGAEALAILEKQACAKQRRFPPAPGGP